MPDTVKYGISNLTVIGGLSFFVFFVAHTWQSEMRPHQIFLPTMELFDAPDNRVALRSILHRANRRLEGWGVSVRWDRDHDLDVVRCGTLLELRLSLDHVLNSTVRMRLDYSLYPNEGLHLSVQSVRHQLELAVRRDKGNGAVVLETRQPNALVELDVLHLDGLPLGHPSPTRPPASSLKQQLIIETQLELWHPTEVRPHFERPQNLAPQQRAVGSN